MLQNNCSLSTFLCFFYLDDAFVQIKPFCIIIFSIQGSIQYFFVCFADWSFKMGMGNGNFVKHSSDRCYVFGKVVPYDYIEKMNILFHFLLPKVKLPKFVFFMNFLKQWV